MCFPYYLLPFASGNLLPFFLAYFFLSYLLLRYLFFRIAALRFQTGCHRRRLNLDYSFFWVQFCVVVFLCLGCMIISVSICLIFSCGVKVVSPCYGHWRDNLN